MIFSDCSKVAEVSQSCQSPCQHTSCQACNFESEPKCKACQKDDFRCLKRYGKCVKRQYCTKRKYPCKPQYSVSIKLRESGYAINIH